MNTPKVKEYMVLMAKWEVALYSDDYYKIAGLTPLEHEMDELYLTMSEAECEYILEVWKKRL